MDRETRTSKGSAKPRPARAPRKRPAAKAPAPAQRLANALAQQSATAEILRLMAASSSDVQPVLNGIAEQAARLCEAPYARILLVDGDMMRISADYTADGKVASSVYDVPLRRTAITGRAVLDRATIHHADIRPLLDREYPDAQRNARETGFGAVLAVPLVSNDTPLGAVILWRTKTEPFAPDQIALVETFARQAAIALANVRQFRATQEALEQQTATSEILRVISRSPTDVRPVFELLAQCAGKLCNAHVAVVSRFDGHVIELAAVHGAVPEAVDIVRGYYPLPLDSPTVTARTVRTAAVVHVADVLDDPSYAGKEFARAARYRASLGVPISHAGRILGTIFVGRTVPGLFTESQVALLRTFADQAVIAIENARLFKELESRNRELTEALDQQTATSEILRAISRSPTDASPVFETIARNAHRLSGAVRCNVLRYDGALLHIAACHGFSPEDEQQLRRRYPVRPGDASVMSGRVIHSGKVEHSDDVLSDPAYDKEHAATLGLRRMLGVPMIRDGAVVGVIVLAWRESGQTPAILVNLLQTFADQAVIAIENVRLFTELQSRNRDLTEALEQQTATSEILRVISRSQTDVQPVFDTIAAAALKLCGATSALVTRVEGDDVALVASANLTAEGAAAMREAFPMRIGRRSTSARAILESRVVTIPDVLEDAEYEVQDHALRAAFRSTLAVPLMRDGRPIGTITVGKPDPGRFSDSQVALLQTFAEQAVIAIENVRLFNALESRNRDLTEALEQQTATSEILRAMSQSPTDTQPVFDVIARSAARLCSANHCHVFRFDGDLVHFVASHGLTPDGLEAVRRVYPMHPGRGSASARAVQSGRVEQIPDLLQDPDFAHGHLAAVMSYRSIVSVPMIREGAPIGAVAVVRSEPGPFPPRQVALLETFADQAVIAIENVRLFTELQARTAQLTRSVGELRALGEVGQAVSSTLDLGTVLSTIVARAIHLTGVDGGSIYEYDEAHGEFHLHTSDRLPPDLVEVMRAQPIRVGEGVLGRMAQAGAPVEIVDLLDASSYQSPARDVLARHGYRSLLAVPLMRDDQLLGGLAVNRKIAGRFDPQVIELLKTFAAQSAIAIQNARLFREIEIKSRELETASRHKSEFLANMSHELRTPLNAIIGFSEVLAERLFGDLNEKQAEYVTDIAESGRHLLALINDILDLSKIEAGRMELDASDVDLPMAIGHTLSLVRERAQRRGIAIGASFEPGVGVVRADERKVKQVLLNLLSNALKFTSEGGTIDVRAAGFDDRVEVSVKDTGVGIAPEDQEAVFEEFRQVGAADKRIGGTGLGLPISRKFIELHGGRLWVASEPGKGSTFTFSLPRR